MKPLTAQDQVRLGFARCFRLALSGMSHRLFRSSITMAILALAVAFLSHMLTFSVIERETQRSAQSELHTSRALGEIVSRVRNVDTPRAIIRGLASADPHRLHEYQVWSELSLPQFTEARAAARDFEEFDAYLQDANPAQRAALFGDQSTDEVSATLAEPGQLQHFLSEVEAFGLRLPLGSEARFRAFVLERHAALDDAVAKIGKGHAAAIAQLEAELAPQNESDRSEDGHLALFEQPPPGLLEAARGQGFDTSVWPLPLLTTFVLRAQDRARLAKAITGSSRIELTRALEVPASELTLPSLLAYIDASEAHAAQISGILARGGVEGLDAPRLAALARDFVRGQRLDRAVGSEVAPGTTWFGISTRNAWLVLLSFLVCGVGVTNAMLMSVGERFSEIATMKCLGALDGFVMTLFLCEAAIQGMIGGVVGLVLGALLALGRALAEYGTLLGSAQSALGSVAVALAVALLLGTFLAALSAVGPSFVAARLSPMEAMRVD